MYCLRNHKLDLRPVYPLLEYLHSLPQGCEDRELSFVEDQKAVEILLYLDVPEDCPRLDRHIIDYAGEEYRKSRSLAVWYQIARSLAYLIEEGE